MSEVAESAESFLHEHLPLDPRPRHRFSFDDVMEMIRVGVLDEDARVELIEGELVEMSPEYAPHRLYKNRLGEHLILALPRKQYSVFVDTTLMLSAHNAPEPDVYVFPRELDTSTLTGAQVSLAIEIADSTLRTDLARKSRLYASFGIPEYWVVDVSSWALWVHRSPDAGAQSYGDVRRLRSDDRITPLKLPEIDFAIDDVDLS